MNNPSRYPTHRRELPAEQVSLLGSVGRGEEHEHSDLGHMVVLRHNDDRGRDGYAIRIAVAAIFVLPVDMLTRSADVLSRYRQDPISMLSRMLDDSEIFYHRRASIGLTLPS